MRSFSSQSKVLIPWRLFIHLSVLFLGITSNEIGTEDDANHYEQVCTNANCDGKGKITELPEHLSEELPENLRTEHGSYSTESLESGEPNTILTNSAGQESFQPVTFEMTSDELDTTDSNDVNVDDDGVKARVFSADSDFSEGNDDSTGDEEPENALPTLGVIGPVRSVEENHESDDGTGSNKENIDQQTGQNPPRRRFFPLLYTLRTLFSSLLSEFGDEGGTQESTFNVSLVTNGNLTASEVLIKEMNTTVNGTDSGKKTRFQCAVKNVTFGVKGQVKIVNSTELLEILNSSKNQKVSACVLVMFYAPWCQFCAMTAPHYNALARAFPHLDVLAVDTSHFSYLNARFGTVAVPNIMLFHARSAVRFNHTTRVLENLVHFVTNNTGLEPDKTVLLEPTDFVGPLPSVVARGTDWLLWLAWAFVITCTTYGFVKSRYGQSFITRLRVLWQEHQHIE